jgi:GDPmannose 4,6-dehydratase
MDGPGLVRLLRVAAPTEIYNLAGQSSVSGSFADPVLTWRTNAESVVLLLEAVRREVPQARVYQASSGEMFGWGPELNVVHDESSLFVPQSPYAVAKAAAHLACATYRRVYGLRVACGILFNHESHRRPSRFLTRKVVDHVRRARERGLTAGEPPLRVGNLRAKRDWGYAPDYVDGIVAVLRQVATRAKLAGTPPEDDDGRNYRDYVLATGRLHAVWELIDRAFSLAGMQLTWSMESDDELTWHARFPDGSIAVEVDPDLLRPSDPESIAADPSLARRELGWNPRVGLDPFLSDMLEHD